MYFVCVSVLCVYCVFDSTYMVNKDEYISSYKIAFVTELLPNVSIPDRTSLFNGFFIFSYFLFWVVR